MTFVMAESNFETCELAGTVLPGVRFDGLRLDIKQPQSIAGDLNLNRVAYEVGDVVLLANYLVNGESALSADAALRQVQMTASDVNDDGVLASVADLRYLLRVVAGDATPVSGAKLSPYANNGQAQYRVENGQLIVSSESNVDLGGAFFIFRTSGLALGSAALSTDASGMTVRSNSMGDQFRVLVSPEAGQIASVGSGRHELFTIPVTGDGSIELVEVQMSDAQGSLLLTSAFKTVLPTDYALAQNYPNPFNAGTVIPFALKDASEWSVTIYNVMGQVVRNFTGHNEAGQINVSWDGSDENGSSVSSGVYFYRVQAGTWNATKKMTLVK
jgi:FlgD Ig-like domain